MVPLRSSPETKKSCKPSCGLRVDSNVRCFSSRKNETKNVLNVWTSHVSILEVVKWNIGFVSNSAIIYDRDIYHGCVGGFRVCTRSRTIVIALKLRGFFPPQTLWGRRTAPVWFMKYSLHLSIKLVVLMCSVSYLCEIYRAMCADANFHRALEDMKGSNCYFRRCMATERIHRAYRSEK